MSQALIEIVNTDLWTNKIREEEVNFFQVYFITLYLLSVYNIIPEMRISKQFLGN